MKKLFISAALTAVVVYPLLSQNVCADQNNPPDDFYIAGNLGQTQYRTDVSHPESVFQNLRFGWRWNGIIGPEIGYAYLGRRKDVVHDSSRDYESSVDARAATLGINSKYNFYQNWFITGHAGYLRSRRTDDDTFYILGSRSSNTSWNNGWYGGLGVGYDVTKNVSLGVNYDNYYLQYGHPGGFRSDVNVTAFSGSVEYRF